MGAVLSGHRTDTVPSSSLLTRMSNFWSVRSQRGRVALDEERFVVGGRVAVGGAVTQDREGAACELVRGGDDGTLVAAAHGERLLVRLELAILRAGGGMGALDQHGS